MMIKEGKGSMENVKDGSAKPSVSEFLKCLEDRRVSLETNELLAVEAANSLMSKLRALVEPFRYVADETNPWEEKSAAARLESKLRKSKRNKLWRKKKRKRIAEMVAKVIFPWFVLSLRFIYTSAVQHSLCFKLLTFFGLLFFVANSRNGSDLTKLTEKLMNGGSGRLPRT